jgi:threonine/homoserine/homoserine lactone efflux protein
MTLAATLGFFAIMLSLALIPSASVALVIARSASLGVKNGLAVAAGIVMGDLVFIAVALFGLSALAVSFGTVFSLFKYFGGAYLIWLGAKLLTSKPALALPVPDSRCSTILESFASGLFLTLGDMKAILFYASLLPTLMDLKTLTPSGIAMVVSITIVTVGGVKVAYALAARHIINRLQNPFASRHTKKIAGSILIGTGAYLVVKA